jgi:hypothetical protein
MRLLLYKAPLLIAHNFKIGVWGANVRLISLTVQSQHKLLLYLVRKVLPVDLAPYIVVESATNLNIFFRAYKIN